MDSNAPVFSVIKIDRFGKETAKLLWDSVSRETVQWLRNCHFGFFELYCLLIHSSTVSVSDELTPETPPWQPHLGKC